MTMLAVTGLRAGYGKIEVLHDVALSVDRGQIVALIGANGAGKTTLLKTISGLIRPTAGTIEFAGNSIVHRRPHKIVALGLSQVPEGRAILKRMTVLDNLRMGAFTRRDAQIGRDIDAVFERFPALGARRHKLAATLSGGEQQMLAIGRGIASSPRLLMLDEPSMGLAPKVADLIFERIGELHRDGLTILLVEQRVAEAVQACDFGYVLEAGRVVLEGSHQGLLADGRIRGVYLGT